MNFSLYAPLRCTALMAVAVLAASLSTGAMAVPTYAVMQDVGGGMFVGGITLDVRNKPDASGDTYVDIGLPGFVAFKKFGFRASGVQTDPQAPILPSQNLGGVQLNGNGAMTGHFLLWAK